MTQEPRRYGFHGTLKAPFHLAEGTSEEELIERLAQFAAERHCFRLKGVDVRAIGNFLALTSGEPNAELQDLARDCVTCFDHFRAPLGESDLARRLATPLTPRQRELLEAWGYAYVMEEFRFHMTLTSSLSEPEKAMMLAELGGRYRQEVQRTELLMNGLALFRQDRREDRFRIVRRFAFMPENKSQALP
jgi:2'-5' RNA ligase